MSTTQKPPVFSDDVVFLNDHVADSDLSTYTNRMVKITATGVALCGSGEDPYGILYNAPTSGQYAEVARGGTILTGVASAAITLPALVKPAANGKLVTASSTDTACGVALSAASGDGALFTFTFQTQKAA